MNQPSFWVFSLPGGPVSGNHRIMKPISLEPIDESPKATTTRIQAALDSCGESGGGRVALEAGRYQSGTLRIPSGVELHLCHGARLLAAEDPELFSIAGHHEESLTANPDLRALIVAIGVADIALTGSGTIDGGGAWEEAPGWLVAQGIFRPAIAYLEGCRNVRIQSLRIVGAKWWTLHLRRCEDVAIRQLTMRNNWPNSDGIDPDGCRNVLISDCNLLCGDDCIVAKSTCGDPCENLTVTNCILETSCAAFKLGTESLGEFRNICISNSILRGDVGFALYMKDGGIMENIQGTNLVIDTESAYPILIDAMARDYQSGKPAGTIRNIQLSHCMVRGPGRVWLEGTPDQPLCNIRLESIDWTFTAPLPEKLPRKPDGSARVHVDPNRPAWQDQRDQVIAVHVDNLTLAGWSFSGPCVGRFLPES